MRYSVKVLCSGGVNCDSREICTIEADSALQAVEYGRSDNLFDQPTRIVDSRDWIASECEDGGAMLAPSKADDQWGGNLCIVADPIEPTLFEYVSALKALLEHAVYDHLPTKGAGAKQQLAARAVAEMSLKCLADACGVDFDATKPMTLTDDIIDDWANVLE